MQVLWEYYVPLYDYQCNSCGHRFENIQKFSDPIITTCPICGKENSVERLISAPAVQFKGSGWYVTDYAKKNAGRGSLSGTTPNSSDSNPSEVKASESKSETKQDTKSESGSKSNSESNSDSKSSGNSSKKSSE